MEKMNDKESIQQCLLYDFLQQWHKKKGIKVRTSGSTGVPKEILLSNDTIERSARRTINYFGLHKKSHLHAAISFDFIGGKMMIARSLVAGCRLTFSEPSLTPELPCGEMPIDLMSVVPAQMIHILDNLDLYRNVKRFLIGGSAVDSRLWDRIVNSGINAWESYGMTETASHVALRRICSSSDTRPRFIPLSGILVNTDSESRIHIRDEKNFFTTNDCGKSFTDGSFVVWGRMDNIIISGGIKINPLQIEDILGSRLSDFLDDFFISSVPDEKWTSKIVLVGNPSIKVCKNDRKVLANQIQNVIENISAEILPFKYRPKEIILKDELAYTASGKLIRKI